MKLRFLMRLKETRLAAITMHGFLKMQTKDLFGLISDYVNIIRLGKINRHNFFKIKIKKKLMIICLLKFTFFDSTNRWFSTYCVLYTVLCTVACAPTM